jgi:hypothetical protein
MSSTKDIYPALFEMGEKYEKLGKAMQRGETTLPELTRLAFACGMELQFRITQHLPPPEAAEPGATV